MFLPAALPPHVRPYLIALQLVFVFSLRSARVSFWTDKCVASIVNHLTASGRRVLQQNFKINKSLFIFVDAVEKLSVRNVQSGEEFIFVLCGSVYQILVDRIHCCRVISLKA